MSNPTIIATMVTDETATIVRSNGVPLQVHVSDKIYEEVVEAIGNSDMDALAEILDRPRALAARYSGFARIEVANGHVLVDGNAVESYLVDRILERANNGDDVTTLMAFLDNVLLNPSRRVVKDLYRFLERSNLPLTEDGCFVAYKGVRENWKDFHSNSMDNSVGQIVSMARNEVNDDITQTCSYGLHACGPTYLDRGYFASGRIILVKINPRDVVAFPNDYDLQKLRCCRYEVLTEIDRAQFEAGVAGIGKALGIKTF